MNRKAVGKSIWVVEWRFKSTERPAWHDGEWSAVLGRSAYDKRGEAKWEARNGDHASYCEYRVVQYAPVVRKKQRRAGK